MKYIQTYAAAMAAVLIGSLSTAVVATSMHVTERAMQTVNTNPPYFQTTNLGTLDNYNVTLGNPLRGLGSDGNNNDAYLRSKIKFSVEVFYYPFSKIVVGQNVYDWTDFDAFLDRIKSRNNHAIPRFYIDYPGNTLALPAYLIDYLKNNGKMYMGGFSGQSPYYDDPLMQAAMKNFIFAVAARYDGDQRLAMIQAGLLGYWAEWHCGNISSIVLPDWVAVQTLQWYDDAFSKTPIQIRYPRKEAYARKFGYHDDSFTYSTLDGPYNGGAYKSYFTEPTLRRLNMTDFWKSGPMGGEVRPENIGTVFEPTYPAGTAFKQDFYACSQLTHATYMKTGSVIRDYAITQAEADKANWNCARMGYSFQAIYIAARVSITDPTKVDIDVVIENSGIAPFYYPLDMLLNCSGIGVPHRISGVETIFDRQSAKTLQYRNVPGTAVCLSKVSFTFDSRMLYPARPIKFSQGDGTLSVNIPLPPTTPIAPVSVPFRTIAPTKAPVVVPVPVPVPSPIPLPSPTTNVIQSLVLKDVGSFKEYPMSNLMTVNLALIGTKALTVVALTSTSSGIRVEFNWTDAGVAKKRVEGAAPWTMGGDSNSLLTPVSYLGFAGSKAVTVIAYSTSTGAVVGSTTVQFTVIDGTVPTTPVITPIIAPRAPTKAPTKAPTRKPTSAPIKPSTNAPIGSSTNSFTSFVLKDVVTLQEYVVSSGSTINLSTIGTNLLTMVAKTASNSGIRVEFRWIEENGINQSRIEGSVPWAMGGDVGGVTFGSVPFLSRPGTKSININAVSTTTGSIVITATVNFIVV